MHGHFLQDAFKAVNHAPEIHDYLQGLRLHFRQNGVDVGVRPALHKVLIRLKAEF